MTEVIAAKKSFGTNFVFGKNCRINCETLSVGDNVTIEDCVQIDANAVDIHDNAIIMKKTNFWADKITIGYKSKIENNCSFSAISGKMQRISLGDFSFIGLFAL